LPRRLVAIPASALVPLATPAPAPAVATVPLTSTSNRVVSVRFSESSSVAHRSSSPRNGCRKISGTLAGVNILHDPQWTFTMSARWCWAAGRIGYKYSDARVDSPGQFWSFGEWVTTSSSAGRKSPWIRYRQAHFTQCIPLPGGASLCGHEAHPWMRFSMYGDGTWEIEHS
jgi:hypothetical protein